MTAHMLERARGEILKAPDTDRRAVYRHMLTEVANDPNLPLNVKLSYLENLMLAGAAFEIADYLRETTNLSIGTAPMGVFRHPQQNTGQLLRAQNHIRNGNIQGIAYATDGSLIMTVPSYEGALEAYTYLTEQGFYGGFGVDYNWDENALVPDSSRIIFSNGTPLLGERPELYGDFGMKPVIIGRRVEQSKLIVPGNPFFSHDVDRNREYDSVVARGKDNEAYRQVPEWVGRAAFDSIGQFESVRKLAYYPVEIRGVQHEDVSNYLVFGIDTMKSTKSALEQTPDQTAQRLALGQAIFRWLTDSVHFLHYVAFRDLMDEEQLKKRRHTTYGEMSYIYLPTPTGFHPVANPVTRDRYTLLKMSAQRLATTADDTLYKGTQKRCQAFLLWEDGQLDPDKQDSEPPAIDTYFGFIQSRTESKAQEYEGYASHVFKYLIQRYRAMIYVEPGKPVPHLPLVLLDNDELDRIEAYITRKKAEERSVGS